MDPVTESPSWTSSSGRAARRAELRPVLGPERRSTREPAEERARETWDSSHAIAAVGNTLRRITAEEIPQQADPLTQAAADHMPDRIVSAGL